MVKTDFVHKVMQCHKLQRSDIMVTCGSKFLISFLIITARNEVAARLYFHRRLSFC